MHGTVLQANGRPAFPAVVTVMTTDGSPVDWSRGGDDGTFSVVLPRAGEYLVLANALGWSPRAQVLRFDTDSTHTCITLTDQLTVSGTASRAGRPVPGAMVAITEASGEMVRSVVADQDGHYCMPLPAAGRYIVTMLEPTTMQAHARKLVLDVRSTVIDIDAPDLASDRVRDGAVGPAGTRTGASGMGADGAAVATAAAVGALAVGATAVGAAAATADGGAAADAADGGFTGSGRER